MYVCMCVYIYIYTYRERCVYIYIYIYIYIRGREGEDLLPLASTPINKVDLPRPLHK